MADQASQDSGEVVPILMPEAGNTMEEGTILEWHVQVGDQITEGQVLCEIETDKATMDYESPAGGRLARIVGEVGVPIAVKEVIAYLADSDAAVDAYLQGGGNETAAPAHAAAERADVAAAIAVPAAAPPAEAGSPEVGSSEGRVPQGRVKASPAARRLAAERGVILETMVAGSGPAGRILSQDVASAGAAQPAARDGEVTRRPMSKMRKAIAVNLQRSKQSIPHFYLKATINAHELMAYYREQKPVCSCTLNDLVVLAVGRAMRDFPAVRSQIDGDQLVEFPHANLGIAVGVDEGLIVPVVLRVDTLSLAELAREAKRVVEAARRGVLENIGKGNFTITNLGMFGVHQFSAIINPPESGILAVSAVREAVLVADGAMRPGRVMTVTLSVDHRIVEGVVAAKFMNRLQTILEHPREELA